MPWDKGKGEAKSSATPLCLALERKAKVRFLARSGQQRWLLLSLTSVVSHQTVRQLSLLWLHATSMFSALRATSAWLSAGLYLCAQGMRGEGGGPKNVSLAPGVGHASPQLRVLGLQLQFAAHQPQEPCAGETRLHSQGDRVLVVHLEDAGAGGGCLGLLWAVSGVSGLAWLGEGRERDRDVGTSGNVGTSCLSQIRAAGHGAAVGREPSALAWAACGTGHGAGRLCCCPSSWLAALGLSQERV